MAISRLFSVQGLNLFDTQWENVSNRLFQGKRLWERNSDNTYGRILCWFRVPLKALQKEFMKRYFSRGNPSFIALSALLYVQKKRLAVFSHSHDTNWHKFRPLSTLFVIWDTCGPHTYLHGPFPVQALLKLTRNLLFHFLLLFPLARSA